MASDAMIPKIRKTMAAARFDSASATIVSTKNTPQMSALCQA